MKTAAGRFADIYHVDKTRSVSERRDDNALT